MEKLLGSPVEVRFLRSYLRHARSLPISTYVGDRTAWSLADAQARAWPCNWDLFDDVVSEAIETLEAMMDAPLPAIPKSRWFLTEHAGTVGGFYSRYSYGYCDIPDVALVATPVGAVFASPDDRALEVARGYLHDCFHAATFRSYGVKRTPGTSPKAPPSVYRYQHGFNFRTADGISYSPPPQSRPGGLTNLGVLMDGIGSILSGGAIERALGTMRGHCCAESLVEDVVCRVPLKNGRKFFADVIVPTHRFFEDWAKISMQDYARFMFSGEVGELWRLFERNYGRSWASVFRQDSFPAGLNESDLLPALMGKSAA